MDVSDSPIVVLFEDRPKQRMVYQLNLSVYLDARVVLANDLTDLKRALAGPEGVQLIVARANFKDGAVVKEVADFFKENKQTIQIIALGGSQETPGVTLVGDDTLVKPMLQNAARILGVTARKMVGKNRPDIYKISPDFLKLLFTFPCDIYEEADSGKTKLFSLGETVARGKVNRIARNKKPLVIDSFERLRLANAVTEQSQRASEDMHSDSVEGEKKITMLSASLEMVAAQFKNAGMDAETVELANASIKAIEKIAESAGNVGNLVRQLMDSEGGYRYAHAQLLTFLGFHVIKMMGWWGEDQRNIISQAAFYHDISLEIDDDGKFRTERQLKDSVIKDPKRLETILTHAQLAARELQAMPEISPEVVRVVIQHHGSSIGRGFSTDLSKLENLTKAFVLSEEWCDYLINLSDSEAEPDNDAKAAELKGIYKDETSQHIIETFRYLEAEAFNSDFLEAVDVGAALAPPAAAAEAEEPAGKDKDAKSSYRGEGDEHALSKEEIALVEEQLPAGSPELAAFKAASKETKKVMLEKLKKKKRIAEAAVEEAAPGAAAKKQAAAELDSELAAELDRAAEGGSEKSDSAKPELSPELKKKARKMEEAAAEALGRPLKKEEKEIIAEELAADPVARKEFNAASDEQKAEILSDLKKKKKLKARVEEAAAAEGGRALSGEEKALVAEAIAEEPGTLEEFKAADPATKEEILAELQEKKKKLEELGDQAEEAVGRKLSAAEKELLAKAYGDDPAALEELKAANEEEKEEILEGLKEKKKAVAEVEEAAEDAGSRLLSKDEKALLAEEAQKDPKSLKKFRQAGEDEREAILAELKMKKLESEAAVEEALETAPRKLTKDEQELLAKEAGKDPAKAGEFMAASKEAKEAILEELKKKRKAATEEKAAEKAKKSKEAAEKAAAKKAMRPVAEPDDEDEDEPLASEQMDLSEEDEEILVEELGEGSKELAFFKASDAETQEEILEAVKNKRALEEANEGKPSNRIPIDAEDKVLLDKVLAKGSPERAVFAAADKKTKEAMLEKIKTKAALEEFGVDEGDKSPDALSTAEEAVAIAAFPENSPDRAAFEKADPKAKKEMIEKFQQEQAAAVKAEVQAKIGAAPAAKKGSAQAKGDAKVGAAAEGKAGAAKKPGASSMPDMEAFKNADPETRRAMLEALKKQKKVRFGAAEEDEAEEEVVKGGEAAGGAGEKRKFAAGSKAGKEEERKFSADEEEEETETTLKDVTHKRKDEARRIAAGPMDDDDEEEEIFGADEERANKEERKFKAGRNDAEGEQRFGKDSNVDESEQRFDGDKEEGADEEQRFKGGNEADNTKRSVKDVTDKRTDEEIRIAASAEEKDESEQRFKGDGSEEDKSESKVEGVTQKINTKEYVAKFEGDKRVEDKSQKTFTGGTDVRKDDKSVVYKDSAQKDGAQKYVDKSVARKNEAGKDGERELKMKAVTSATDLMKACLGGDLVTVAELLVSNLSAQLRKTDAEGRTCFQYAAMGGSKPVLKFLLEKGAQLNAVDAKRRTALFLAALHKQNDAFDFILGQGAKINQQAMGGMNIAMVAAFTNNVHIMKVAVQKKVRLDTADHSGKTAHEYAKMAKAADILNLLETIKAASSQKRASGTSMRSS